MSNYDEKLTKSQEKYFKKHLQNMEQSVIYLHIVEGGGG